MRVKQTVAFSLIAALGLLLMARYLLAVQSTVASERSSACAALQPELIEMPARDFELADLGGKKLKLSSLRGKVVLLNFWATWCPPCVEEIPSLVELQQAMQGQDFELVTVSVDESPEIVKEFLAKQKQPSLPVLLDSSKQVPLSYGTSKFPETFVIDRNGVARYKFIYKRDWSSAPALSCLRSLL